MKRIVAIMLLTVIIVSMLSSCQKHKHQFGEWKTTKETSCSKTGLKERICDCGERETKAIPTIDHNFVDGICEECNQITNVPTSDEYFVFTELDDGTYSVAAKDIENLPATVIIPSSYNGKPVTVIAENAFGSKIVEEEVEYKGLPIIINKVVYCSFTTVVIPDSITKIDNKAFSDCNNLTRVEVGNSVTHIGDYAFQHCKFKTIDLSNTLTTYIGKWAFMSYLQSITLPDTLTTIAPYAFHSSSLITITIPESVTEIGAEAFSLCSFLREIVNNSSVDLSHATMLSSILEIHTGTSKIIDQNGYLFYKHEGKNLLIRYVGEETDLILPKSISGESYEIYSHAFSSLHNIKSVVIPEGVEVIHFNAFFWCESLEEAYIPKSLTTIYGVPLFSSCNMFTDVYYSGTQEEGKAITIKPQKTHASMTYTFEDVIAPAEIHYNYQPE